MKIALVLAPPYPREFPSYDLAITAAILRREGHDVKVFDYNNGLFMQTYKQRPNWKFQFSTAAEEPAKIIQRHEKERLLEAAKELAAYGADAVVFKALASTMVNAEAILVALKQIEPGMKVVCSGEINPDPTALSQYVAHQKYKAWDHFIFGEDDVALPRLLAGLKSGGVDEGSMGCPVHGKVVDSSLGPRVNDLDTLPFYDFSDYDTMNYGRPNALELVWSRGCPWRCAFCQDWFERGKFRCMSGQRIFEEFKHQTEKNPALDYIHSYDRTMNGNPAALEAFCERMIARYGDKPPVVWAGDIMMRPEMTSALIDKMAKAGCRGVGCGFESGSHRVRKSMDKGSFSNELALRVFSDFNRNRIAVSVNVMVGFPTETREDFAETIGFLDRLAEVSREDWAWDVRLTFATARIGFATSLYEHPDRYNIAAGSTGEIHNENWVSLDGGNTFEERTRRFQELCERVLSNGMKLTVNRRMIKNEAGVNRLMKELVPASGVEAD